MISWIQNHLIRHGRWIFISLLAIVIIAFVFTIGNTPGITTNDSNYKQDIIFGIDLNNKDTGDKLFFDTYYSSMLKNESGFRTDQDFLDARNARIVSLYLIDSFGLLAPNEEKLIEYIKNLPFFKNEKDQFDNALYEEFKSNLRISESQFMEILSDDYRIEKINKIIEGPGYYTDDQVEVFYDLENTYFDIYNVKLDYESFVPEYDLKPDTLKSYYEEKQISYKTPEQIITSYVVFPSIEAAFSFQDEIHKNEILLRSDEFIDLLEKYSIEELNIEPYSKDQISEKSLPSNMLESGFSLNDKRYYSEPFLIPNDQYAILFYIKTLEQEIPSYEAIADIVENDYKNEEKRKQFNSYGKELKAMFETTISNDEDFLLKTKELDLDIEHFEKFSLYNPPEGSNRFEFLPIINNSINEGEVSDMINFGEYAIITYLKSVFIDDYVSDANSIENYKEYVKSLSKSSSKSEYYKELYNNERNANSN